jgi:chromosome segregation ATPase
MPERAHVTSLDALESFRSSLIIYLTKARPTLDEVSGDLLRMRVWLQDDQRTYWEQQVRRRAKVLEQAEQALFGARLSNLRDTTDAERVAVQRARRALQEAEAKLKRVKQWSREFDSRIEPMGRQLEHLRNILATDMPNAVAYLAQAIRTLSDYAGIAAVQGGAGLSQPSAPNAANAAGASPPGAASPSPQPGTPGAAPGATP